MSKEKAPASARPASFLPGLAAVDPLVYATVLVAAFAAAFIYEARFEGIFACPASAYSADSYLAYCNAVGYGDFDHGALWFDLEPEVLESAGTADVLFLGSSRMEFGFSAAATRDWFTARSMSFYLLGFSHTENVVFTTPLLEKISPRAGVFVINLDRFFDDRETPPVQQIFHDDQAASRYRRKRLWQYPHRVMCGIVAFLCGEEIAFFRSRPDGEWRLGRASGLTATGVEDLPLTDREGLQRALPFGDEFLSRLSVPRSCVILTLVPSLGTSREEAAAVATALGTEFVYPDLEGLRTFDGSHLDPPSAERWSRAFMDLADPVIDRCSRLSGSE